MAPELTGIVPSVCPLDSVAMDAARTRQRELTKPPGSLGRLEDLAIQLAGISRNACPSFPRKAILLLAADHGVAAEGVSAYPQAVTAQMVLNFLRGGAAINVLARQAGARVMIADLGVASDLPEHPDLTNLKIDYGTANLAHGPAMRRDQATAAIRAGIRLVERAIDDGLDLVATGDMGIANTTAASAIIAVMTGLPVERVTGRGTGLDDLGWAHKVTVIERALAATAPDRHDPLDVLAKVGGYEIAGLVGVILQGAAGQIPVLLDGLASGAAALLAVALQPTAAEYLIAAHRSVEVGHSVVLEHLGLHPLLDLDLRLGEGTGAALAMPLIDGAVALLAEMATFADAGVSEPPR